jgi:hypothetical protein
MDLGDSPDLSRAYCPGCEPSADPLREILRVFWCAAHAPSIDGPDDDLIKRDLVLSGSGEAGGWETRAMCALLHRARRRAP